MKELQIRTDFTNTDPMTRSKEILTSLNQPSQVHEFVVQLLLSRKYNIKGINFVVKDPARHIVEIQIQTYWWDSILDARKWDRRCWEMSRLVSTLMPIGLCTIKPI